MTMYMLWISLMLLVWLRRMVLMLVMSVDIHDYDDDTDHDTDDDDDDTDDDTNDDTDDDTDDVGRGNLHTIKVPGGKVCVPKIGSWS